MVSEVEPVAKNATGSCFAKVHDVFTLTYSAYSKTDADSPSSAAANNNTKGEGEYWGCARGFFVGFGISVLGIFMFVVYIH